MKYSIFLIILFLSACEHKVSRTSPYEATADKRPTDSALLKNISRDFSSRAEGVYGLLWPQDLDRSDPAQLATIMSRARNLQETRKLYSIENQRIQTLNGLLNCECATAGICDADKDPNTFPPDTLERCTSLEDEKFSNDQKLSVLLDQQASLKVAVLDAGGDWLENDPIDLRLDFVAMTFELSAFRFANLNKDAILFEVAENDQKGPYDKGNDRMIQKSQSIYWAAGQNIEGGSLKWELDGLELPGALQFQGKLAVEIDGVKRQGQIGFQLPRK